MSLVPIFFWLSTITNIAMAHSNYKNPILPSASLKTSTMSSKEHVIPFDGLSTPIPNSWTHHKFGEKTYSLGVFFQANWYRAAQFCRYHSMHLASITSQEENDMIGKHINDFGMDSEDFWTSGTDLGKHGEFIWMSTGYPLTFTNWNIREPNNLTYKTGEGEHCVHLEEGYKWNDAPCSIQKYFVCEVNKINN